MEIMSLASINKLEILRDRAAQLARCRHFFAERNVLEVDVPILSRSASVDLHIDLVTAKCCGQTAYLHSSPEYGMKRLLSQGMGDIYQLSHVFRDHERGDRHTSEFMMVEWYRIGFTLKEMIEETLHLMRLFIDDVPLEYEEMSYRESFMRNVGRFPPSLEERDALYGFEIEPLLGKKGFTVINGFPPEQAALAQVDGAGIAQRFEIYYQGLELANGYHELLDPNEQRQRFKDANHGRVEMGKDTLPVDAAFIEALEKGLPDCCGVAVGFDRLMMLRHRLEEIRDGSCFFI